MNPIVIVAVFVVVAGGIYLYTRSPSPSPTLMPTTPVPTTPMPTTPVPTTPAPVVDCQVSDWSEWGGCSKQCGGGTQTQTRKITVQPQNGGRECPSLFTQSRACNEQLCPPCKYLDWLKCDCLAKQQTRVLDPSSPIECVPGATSQSCTPVDCDWYGFDTTYVSDGEYFSRDYTPDLASCYHRCENDPTSKCAAVYAYDGPGMPYNNSTNRPLVECSLIKKENVDVLYNNYISPNAFRDAKNRHAFVNSKLAGDKFRPNIGTRV